MIAYHINTICHAKSETPFTALVYTAQKMCAKIVNIADILGLAKKELS